MEAGRPETAQKANVVRHMGAERVVAIGNGANDADMLREAAVIGPEGLAMGALATADVVVASIDDALGLLRSPKRLVATLRRWLATMPNMFERAANESRRADLEHAL